MKYALISLLALSMLVAAAAFVQVQPPRYHGRTTQLTAQGFGKSNRKEDEFGKTYGEEAKAVIRDVIDVEGAMSEFFSSNEDWHPLFKSLATSASVPGMSFLQQATTMDDDYNNGPWRRLDAIPSDEGDRQVLAQVLDVMQESLIAIPVNEAVQEDEDDLHFLEEGRRMLAISRFHVLQGVHGGSMQGYDRLFSTCWSELMELSRNNEENTGSLIVVPEYELSDLKRFTDINLLRPMEWLGMNVHFEVASMQRGSPAIRLLHKLQDMPDEPWSEEEAEES